MIWNYFIKQIYTSINDKLVGLLLRARKYKFVEFEGEMLFQRRDDDVPIFMLKTIDEVKVICNGKIDEVRRSASPNPVATSLLIKWTMNVKSNKCEQKPTRDIKYSYRLLSAHTQISLRHQFINGKSNQI